MLVMFHKYSDSSQTELSDAVKSVQEHTTSQPMPANEIPMSKSGMLIIIIPSHFSFSVYQCVH